MGGGGEAPLNFLGAPHLSFMKGFAPQTPLRKLPPGSAQEAPRPPEGLWEASGGQIL